MVDRMGAWRRRRVLAGMIGTTAVLGAPAILRAAPSGKPVRVGGTLSLTGFLAQTAQIHKIAAEIMVEEINGRNGFLGRPVEYVLLDDQSKPDVARSLYEKLITVDKVDLIQGPYATAPILAAMGVAQRYGKVIIQSSMGIPKLQTYDMAFPATPFGPEPGPDLSQRDPRCDGEPADAAQDHRHPHQQVPLGAVHGAGHARAVGEARRQGRALSRIRIGQPRLRRHRGAREGGQRRLPVGGLAGTGEQPGPRSAAQARLHAQEQLPPLSGAGPAGACRPTARTRSARPSSSLPSRS